MKIPEDTVQDTNTVPVLKEHTLQYNLLYGTDVCQTADMKTKKFAEKF